MNFPMFINAETQRSRDAWGLGQSPSFRSLCHSATLLLCVNKNHSNLLNLSNLFKERNNRDEH